MNTQLSGIGALSLVLYIFIFAFLIVAVIIFFFLLHHYSMHNMSAVHYSVITLTDRGDNPMKQLPSIFAPKTWNDPELNM